ncbi:hypothetical protein EMIT047CA2_50225 [Pseudomonas soli]
MHLGFAKPGRFFSLCCSNWLFAGPLRSDKRATAIIILIQSARDLFVYLKEVLTRVPTQRASKINDLLPQKWVNTLG